MITTVLRVFFYGLFVRADLPIFPIVLFGCLLVGIFFGTIRSVIVSCAGVAVLAAARFRAAPLMPALWLCPGRLVLDWLFLVLAVILFGCIHHVYVVRRSGRPASSKWRVLALLLIGIVVHTVDVFGAVIKNVG